MVGNWALRKSLLYCTIRRSSLIFGRWLTTKVQGPKATSAGAISPALLHPQIPSLHKSGSLPGPRALRFDRTANESLADRLYSHSPNQNEFASRSATDSFLRFALHPPVPANQQLLSLWLRSPDDYSLTRPTPQ